MDYTGNIMMNVFAGNEAKGLAPMERSIIEFGADEYAFYLNVSDDAAIIAVHRVIARDGTKLTIHRNAIAQAPARKVEADDRLEGYEFVQLRPLALDNGYIVDGFAFSEVRESQGVDAEGKPRISRYRLCQPRFIAEIRAKQQKKPVAPAPTPERPAKRSTKKSDSAEF